ncbi:hypothetical protein THRCLA_20319 [Thraustotheca clavata]|uniref:Uncharacterized protein n=1 Tax=Thraustotheca clavata TaxID=74557 RepID=A0A1W0A8W4_9STRA|nr:hypothetical protein THRCLA_20319 [Thraustotheca clavata]
MAKSILRCYAFNEGDSDEKSVKNDQEIVLESNESENEQNDAAKDKNEMIKSVIKVEKAVRKSVRESMIKYNQDEKGNEKIKEDMNGSLNQSKLEVGESGIDYILMKVQKNAVKRTLDMNTRTNAITTSPLPSKYTSTPPSVVAKQKNVAKKNRFLNRLQIDMKEPLQVKEVAPTTRRKNKSKKQFTEGKREAARKRMNSLITSPKLQMNNANKRNLKGKRRLQFQQSPSESECEDSEDSKEEKALPVDESTEAITYPWLVRHNKKNPPPEDWMWKLFDAEHFQPISTKRIEQLDEISESIPNTLTPFLYSDDPAMKTILLTHPKLHFGKPFEMPPRGRYYREIWEDELFASSSEGFTATIDNQTLVSGYDDDLFEQYYTKLEKHYETGTLDDTVLPDIPTLEDSTVKDEIEKVLDECIAAYVPQVISNWETSRTIAERIKQVAGLETIHRHEKELVERIEQTYKSWKDTPRRKSSNTDLRMASRLRRMNSSQASAYVYATRFAMRLELGDAVDFLDHTGLWESAFVCDRFVEGDKALTHVKLQLHSQSIPEWCCVYDGRLLPAGSITSRIAPLLDVNLATINNDPSYSVKHAKLVIDSKTSDEMISIARQLEQLRKL